MRNGIGTGTMSPSPVAAADHKQFCEGHLDCPDCGDMCGKPVVWDQDDNPQTVLCLGCYQTFAVDAPRTGTA